MRHPTILVEGLPRSIAEHWDYRRAQRHPGRRFAKRRVRQRREIPWVAKISLQEAKDAYEARYITQVLAEHGGNVSHAAVALRLSSVALQKKMKRYGLR
jgi:transcriptional regulator with PAS, ATPase and Fis domain